jgi:lysophospholipase L1-like esterase
MLPLAHQEFKIPAYADKYFTELGHDSLKHCFDRKHFKLHKPVIYQFNELGFRERSISQFQGNEIIVVGDSFTLGLGVNVEDRWSNRLQQLISRPVLNFSLNGASNDWIARKCNQLMSVFEPPTVIVHWTFSHRRESARIDWFDDERTLCDAVHTYQENLHNWHKNFQAVDQHNVVHSFIPNWHPGFDYSAVRSIGAIEQIDLARDGFHYGPATHQRIADAIAKIL